MMKLMHAAISGLWRFLRASCADKHGHFLGAHIPRLGAEDLGAMIAVVSGAQTGTKCLLGDQAPPPGLLENGNKNAELGDFAAQLCFFGMAFMLALALESETLSVGCALEKMRVWCR
jgi:hypothetical protein